MGGRDLSDTRPHPPLARPSTPSRMPRSPTMAPRPATAATPPGSTPPSSGTTGSTIARGPTLRSTVSSTPTAVARMSSAPLPQSQRHATPRPRRPQPHRAPSMVSPHAKSQRAHATPRCLAATVLGVRAGIPASPYSQESGTVVATLDPEKSSPTQIRRVIFVPTV